MEIVLKIFLIAMIVIFTVFALMVLVFGFVSAFMELKEKHNKLKDKEKEWYE